MRSEKKMTVYGTCMAGWRQIGISGSKGTEAFEGRHVESGELGKTVPRFRSTVWHLYFGTENNMRESVEVIEQASPGALAQ